MKSWRNLALVVSLILLAVAMPLTAQPQRVLYVPGEYPTIAAALSAAASGDTVQVAAGTYAEGGLHIPSGVALVGAGWQTTTIDGGGAVDVVLYPHDGSTVEGFTIRGSGPDYFNCGIWVSQGAVAVRHTRLTGNSAGLWAWCFDPATCAINIILEHNLIVANSRSGVSSNEHPRFIVRYNTVADNGADGVTLIHADSLAENNVIVGNANRGLVKIAGATARYNAVWGNGQDYNDGTPGPGDLPLDPFFRDAPGGDYRLHAGSPVIGRGDPAGTDMGALLFIPVGTPPTALRATAVSTFTWELNWEGNDAAGYTVYLGAAADLYTRRFDAGSETTFTLSHLPGGLSYYAAVSAYTTAGDESHVTTPVSFTVPAAPAGHYEEDSAAVTFSGDWTYREADEASGGGYAASTTVGATAQFTFSGDSVALYRRLGPDGGRATVSINGVSYGTLEFYFFEPRWQVPALYDGLGAGVHTLTLRVSADAHGSSSGHIVTVDAFAVPSPYPPTPEQDAALDRVNWHRQLAGIPPVRQDGALNRAAQAHAEYAVIYHEAHRQTPGNPGFIGEWPSERAAYFGYSGGVGEDMHGIGNPSGAVDGWMETVYHRNLIMGYGFADMGYGLALNAADRSDVLKMSSRNWSGPAPDTRYIYTYPADGQTDVPHLWGGGEAPDPLPGVPKPVGYPVSLYIAQPNAQQAVALSPDLRLAASQSPAWAVTLAELRDAGGQLVPAYLLHQDTDLHGMGPDVVFLIAHSPLAFGTTYTSRVAGSDSHAQPFDHTWSFTTEVAANIRSVNADVDACEARVGWNTAGPATTFIEYGTTPAYGHQLPGESTPATSHGATLSSLTPETTYHYRIVAQDTQGYTRATEDRTFTTRAPRILSVPDEYGTLAAALQQASQCDVVQAAAGTYFESNLAVPNGVLLQGTGWTQTTIAGAGAGSVLALGPGSTVEGFTIRGSGTDYFDAGVWLSHGPATLKRNHITGNATGVWAWCFDAATCDLQVTLADNLITGNARDGLDSNEFGVFTVRNNTVVSNGGRGITLNHAGAWAANNIVAGNGATGIANNAGAAVQYNLAWDNGVDYGGAAGAGNLTADPFFRNAPGDDYRLRAGSPAVGRGTPSGTDIGALAFTPVGAPPAGLQVQFLGADTWRVSWTNNDAAGYFLYVGDTPGLYTHYFDAGGATTYDLHGLAGEHVYYFTLSSYDAAGDESVVAPELVYTPSVVIAPQGVTLLGPDTGWVGQAYTFQALVSPANASTPLTYTWQTTEQTLIQVGDVENTATLTWLQPGPQTFTVTAHNPGGVVTATHTLTLQPVGTTQVAITGPTAGFAGQPLRFTATTTLGTALLPDTYVWEATDHAPVTRTAALQDSVTFTWDVVGSKQLTVTVQRLNETLVLYDQATHTVLIVEAQRVYLPLVLRSVNRQ